MQKKLNYSLLVILLAFYNCFNNITKKEKQLPLTEIAQFEYMSKGFISSVHVDHENFKIEFLTDRLNFQSFTFQGKGVKNNNYYTKTILGSVKYDPFTKSTFLAEGEIIKTYNKGNDWILSYPCSPLELACRINGFPENYFYMDLSKKYVIATNNKKIDIFDKNLKLIHSFSSLFDGKYMIKYWNNNIFSCDCPFYTSQAFFENSSKEALFFIQNFKGELLHSSKYKNISNINIVNKYMTVSSYNGTIYLLNDKLKEIKKYKMHNLVYDSYYDETNDLFFVLIDENNKFNLVVLDSNFMKIQELFIASGNYLFDRIKLFYADHYLVVIENNMKQAPDVRNTVKLYSF